MEEGKKGKMVLGYNVRISKTLSDYKLLNVCSLFKTAVYIVDKLSPFLKHLVHLDV